MAERTSQTSQMSVGEFERIAEFAAKETDAVRFEFINGRIGVKLLLPEPLGIELDTEELEQCVD
ncbi:hypothetical protein [Streptomyces canus]|uniref:hypothetical protein n=1 Tax=Streptomyces canus TaxID=58343 RepID=UPI003F542529